MSGLRAFAASALARLARLASRLSVRLLLVHLVVLLVPFAGLEFARLFERRLLDALERDMRNQAALVTALIERDLEAGVPLDDPRHEALLRESARTTRTRIRVLDPTGVDVVDSHRDGAPEGPEPGERPRIAGPAPTPSSRVAGASGAPWPVPGMRPEVRRALAGIAPSTATRVRARAPQVVLFLAWPVRAEGRVVGVVYVARSTTPVLADLHRIRAGLVRLLVVALVATSAFTILLALSLTRPIGRLAERARRIAAGERGVVIEPSGSGEVRELGEAVRTMTEQLERRLDYARELAADVAHEFKSPLTSIRGAAELLAEGAADDPAARVRFLANIQLDVDRLDRLVSRLLDLGRVESARGGIEPVDLVALVDAVRLRCGSPDVAVRRLEPDGVALAAVRADDVEMAVSNLVENAVRFAPAGSTVRLVVRRDGPWVLVRVEDDGPGIAKEHEARVFERFFTTDVDRDGTGLGLAIARSVALAHGGELVLASARHPTAFELRLPRAG